MTLPQQLVHPSIRRRLREYNLDHRNLKIIQRVVVLVQTVIRRLFGFKHVRKLAIGSLQQDVKQAI